MRQIYRLLLLSHRNQIFASIFDQILEENAPQRGECGGEFSMPAELPDQLAKVF